MREIEAKDFDGEIMSGNVVVDFWGEGCLNCKMVEPFLTALEGENPNVKFIKINTGTAGDLTERFGVSALPTMLFIKDGEVRQTLVGLKPRGVLARTINDTFNL